MERLMIKEVIDTGWFPGEICPTPLKEVMDWFIDVTNKIPCEFQDSAKFEIDAYEQYGDLDISVNVTYTRTETDEEYNARKKINEARSAKQEEIKETCERELLKQLIEKYGEDK